MPLFLLLAGVSLGGPAKQVPTDDAWPDGSYEFAHITITNAPLRKPDGTTWDPRNGLADLYLIVYTTPGGSDEWQEGIITSYFEAAGSDAELGSWILPVAGDEAGSSETRWLWFQVIDYDTDTLEIMDESGSVSIGDLSPSGWNSVTCERGTFIQFYSSPTSR